MTLTLEIAQQALNAARARAVAIRISATIVVCDGAGHLKALARMDGAWLGSIDVALRKARTSVLFETETQNLWEVCKPDAQAHGLENTNGGLVTFAGGIPIRASTGALLGAVGVSGGQVLQDYEIAQAAVVAVGTFINSMESVK